MCLRIVSKTCYYRLLVLGSRFKDLNKALMQHSLRVTKQILLVVQDIQVIPTLLTLLIKNHRLVNNNSGVWVTFKPLLIKSHPQSIPKCISIGCTASYLRKKTIQDNFSEQDILFPSPILLKVTCNFITHKIIFPFYSTFSLFFVYIIFLFIITLILTKKYKRYILYKYISDSGE